MQDNHDFAKNQKNRYSICVSVNPTFQVGIFQEIETKCRRPFSHSYTSFAIGVHVTVKPNTNSADDNHLKTLSEYLWHSPRRAALMVGAGFSMNSRHSSCSSKRMPRWNKLVQTLSCELGYNTSQKTFDPTTIASEYAAVFGENRLWEKIRKMIDDNQFEPSQLHTRLLNLPWVDVFTTNYDTLLERTHAQRRYSPITKPDELTYAAAPRIIKLHGSLPSETPFVMTKENFRKYPQDYPVFVNTVRQALIQNAFVLVGFSGDDPNFSAWLGWTRDVLDNKKLPVYLVGLEFSRSKRRLLEKEGVSTIDMTPLNGEIDHSGALSQFISYLENSRPIKDRYQEWPNIS